MDQNATADVRQAGSGPLMSRALELAARGRGAVSPNPLVGAVIADAAGEVLGEGWHAQIGGRHAEVAAIEDARERGVDVSGASMYVTLEPCAHEGRQPPCADAIIAAGIGRVTIASDDPTEKANGRGPGVLREGGVVVEWAGGADAAAARLLNQPFRKHARTGRPLVVFKSALTLDGWTATGRGDSKWISGPQSRELVHHWRGEVDAVAVGIGTALADDPLLTARGVGEVSQPTRIVFDSAARVPLDGELVGSAADAPVIVVARSDPPAGRVEALELAGVEVLPCSGEGPARIGAALDELGRRGITSLMLEGGPTLAGSFRDAGEIDELRLFHAPILLGGGDARPLLSGAGPQSIEEGQLPIAVEWVLSGPDMLSLARMREW